MYAVKTGISCFENLRKKSDETRIESITLEKRIRERDPENMRESKPEHICSHYRSGKEMLSRLRAPTMKLMWM